MRNAVDFIISRHSNEQGRGGYMVGVGVKGGGKGLKIVSFDGAIYGCPLITTYSSYNVLSNKIVKIKSFQTHFVQMMHWNEILNSHTRSLD